MVWGGGNPYREPLLRLSIEAPACATHRPQFATLPRDTATRAGFDESVTWILGFPDDVGSSEVLGASHLPRNRSVVAVSTAAVGVAFPPTPAEPVLVIHCGMCCT